MKLFTKLVMVTFALLALLGSTSVALAQEVDSPERDRRGGVRGEVTAVGTTSLTVAAHNGDTVTVHVSSDTRIRLVESQQDGELEDIDPGNFVGAAGNKNDDGSVNARFILVFPEKPTDLARVRGKVTEINGNVIEIENRQGESQEITTDKNTRFRIGGEPGSLEDISIDDPLLAVGVERDDGTFLAKLVVVITRDQLRRHTLRGEVLAKDLDAGTLTVQPAGNQEKAWLVKTTDQTKYRVPGVESPSLDDVEVGARVLVIGQPEQNDDGTKSGIARLIAVIPQDALRVRGEVTDVDQSNKTFELQTARGNFTILTDENTRYRTRGDEEVSFEDIEEGSKAIVFGKKAEEQENTIQARLVGIPPSID